MFIKAIRQQLFFKKIDIIIPFKDNVLIYFSALSMILTPAGTGELIKSIFLKQKHGYSITRSFPIVFVEKFHDLLAPVIIVATFLVFNRINEAVILNVALLIFLLIAYIAIRIKKLFKKIIRVLSKISRLKKFSSNIAESYDVFYGLTSKKIIAKGLLLSLGASSLDVIAIYLVFVAFNLNFSIIYTTIVVFSSIIFGGITFLPGGVGITEVSLTGLLARNGVELSLIASIVIMIRLVSVWFATALGFIATEMYLTKK